jgi:hypothetical protein
MVKRYFCAVFGVNISIEEKVKPQEAFLVNIKNRYISFFHLLVSAEYINDIKKRKVPKAIINSFPDKDCPLDLMYPSSRKQVLLVLHCIARYLRSSQFKIGNY